jgi:hypothetical protein
MILPKIWVEGEVLREGKKILGWCQQTIKLKFLIRFVKISRFTNFFPQNFALPTGKVKEAFNKNVLRLK